MILYVTHPSDDVDPDECDVLACVAVQSGEGDAMVPVFDEAGCRLSRNLAG